MWRVTPKNSNGDSGSPELMYCKIMKVDWKPGAEDLAQSAAFSTQQALCFTEARRKRNSENATCPSIAFAASK